MLKQSYIRMYCLRLRSVKHSKNCFARIKMVRITHAVVQVKQLLCHTINSRTVSVQRYFYFAMSELKKSYSIMKNSKIINYYLIRTFFVFVILKIKNKIEQSFFLISSVNIWLFNWNYVLNDSYQRKTVLAMLYICKTETTRHARFLKYHSLELPTTFYVGTLLYWNQLR